MKEHLPVKNSENHKPILISQVDRIPVFVESLLEMYGSKDDYPITKQKLTELLHLLISSEYGNLLKDALLSIDQNRKQSIKPFMEQYFDKPLKIEDYANLTGRSVASFHRDFKRVFNEAPKQWLISKRLEKAKSSLEKDRKVNISQVAAQSGYESSGHFIKSFQSRFGISPKQFVIENHKNLGIS